MAEKIDRRAVRTRAALRDAMLDLLQKKDIAKITVSELAERADIGRGTFYLHYTDPYDLLDKLENEMLDEITASAAPIGGDWNQENLLAHLLHVWRYIYEHQTQINVLLRQQDGNRFLRKFRAYSEQAAANATKGKLSVCDEDAYELTYMISGIMGIFQKWMEDGTVIPPKRLAQIARNIIQPMQGEEQFNYE